MQRLRQISEFQEEYPFRTRLWKNKTVLLQKHICIWSNIYLLETRSIEVDKEEHNANG